MSSYLSDKTTVTTVAVLVVAVVGGGYYLVRSKEKKSVKVYRSDPKGCKDIIEAKFLPPNLMANTANACLINLIKPEEARARPNARLVHAFGIDNCFTTSERRRCATFRGEAAKMVKLDETGWKELAFSVHQIVQQQCSQSSNISLFETTQLVTMKAALKPLLNVDISDSSLDQAISKLAAEINQQWLRSKKPSVPGTAFKAQESLKELLHAIVPEWDETDSTANPLNFILPGYETMWRVVLRCFIEVVYRSTPSNASWRRTLEDFAKNPTTDQLEMSEDYGGVSASMVADEALRLYPPTRRIYRDFETTSNTVQAAANIELCHRDSAIWGEDASLFNPCRWAEGIRKTDEFKKENFLPFGASPFTCVAKHSAGGMLPFGVGMIALLVGSLSLAVGKDFELVGEEDWADGKSPLRTDREAYEKLHLLRKLASSSSAPAA